MRYNNRDNYAKNKNTHPQTLISLADFYSHVRSPSFALSIHTLSTHLPLPLLFILISVRLMAALFPFFFQGGKFEIFVRIISNVLEDLAHLAPLTEFWHIWHP
jgi:hypothetical protein